MKAILPITLALSCFANVGNSQDSAERPTYGPAATAFDTQGNVAYNMSKAELELATAAQQARRRKEQMYERAAMSSAPAPPVPRTAAEYLAANMPPPMPEPLQPRNTVQTNRDYVPPFTNESSPVTPEQGAVAANDAPTSDFGMLKKPGGLFKLFGGKKQQANASVAREPIGATTYQTTSVEPGDGADTPPAPDSVPIQRGGDSTGAVMDPNSIDALISEAAGDSESTPSETQVGNDRKSGLLSKLFKKRDDSGTSVPAGASASGPVSAPAGEMAATDAPTTPAPPAGNGEIPDPVAYDAPAPPAPSATPPPTQEGPAPIFQRRESGDTGGTSASVARTGTAMVNGVKVKLYKGSNVRILRKSGGTAQIRLPDGRTGTVDSSLLQ
ncbi:MAG: hypothetical protein L7V87_06325 [Verrucomicrobiales bacterium]|nr:hypothetical protein [Verrucomicrobiales bacterium]